MLAAIDTPGAAHSVQEIARLQTRAESRSPNTDAFGLRFPVGVRDRPARDPPPRFVRAVLSRCGARSGPPIGAPPGVALTEHSEQRAPSRSHEIGQLNNSAYHDDQ